MQGWLLLRGLVIGLSISVPVGPIGVLVIRRTLAEGRRVGIVSGLGSACGTAVYGGVAGFGLTAVSDGLLRQQRWLSLIGGLCLLYIGYTIVRGEPATEVAADVERSLARGFSSTLFLTLISPAVVLSFLAIFAGAALVGPGGDYVAAASLVFGVFAGSALWWVGLSTLVALLRSRLNGSPVKLVRRRKIASKV